jgi:ligand-binding SRPBCC domain-containing protein
MRHCMLNVILANWAVVVRDVGNRHFTDEMLKGPMAAFRHEHQVEVGGGRYAVHLPGGLSREIGGAPLEWLMVNGYMM